MFHVKSGLFDSLNMSKPEQTGIYLGFPDIERDEIKVPAPPANLAELDPKVYHHLLPGTLISELGSMIVPISRKIGYGQLVVVFDKRWRPPHIPQNEQATKLTASLETGFGKEIFGPAVVFYATPGQDFPMKHYNLLDDVIRNFFFDKFERGKVPNDKDYKKYQAWIEQNAPHYT